MSAALEHAPAPFEHAQLERLALFAGFITKIKHNPLRTVLPLTFRLLALLDAEIDFFAAYAPAYAEKRAAGALSEERRIALLEQQLDAFAAQRPPQVQALLRGVLAHEATVHRLVTSEASPGGEAASGIGWCGRAALGRYRVDVARACEALRARRFAFDADVVVRDQILLYRQLPERGEIAFFEIDELTWLLCSLVDGQRTPRDVAAAVAELGFSSLAPAEVEAFFADAAQRGYVTLGAACA